MWLLSTDRAELQFFPSLEKAKCSGYAILSHVWDDVEQSFQDTEALRRAGKAEDGYNPRDHSSAKVRESCMLAERHGYKWIWNDASCIDKTSSAELSEAINSMFSYYAHAEVCYAFLADVPQDDAFEYIPPAWPSDSPFAQSRWFHRGWTLQELIAPAQVIFLSSSWSILGTKAEHASVLSDITKIPVTILTFEEEIWDICIASRMSWASRRKTTRTEDAAYSLMGIFDVHMPTIYGEGENAFRRLQEELMRKRIDATLFAWGGMMPSDNLPNNHIPFDHHHDAREMYLFATSPSDFRSERYAPRMAQTPAKMSASLLRRATMALSRASPPGIPSFEITPYGVRARMRVFKIHGFDIADLHISYNNTHPSMSEYDPVGLLLGRSVICGDPRRPLYHSCVTTVFGTMHRLINVGSITRRSPKQRRRFDTAPWMEFYLTHLPPKPLLAVTRHIMNHGMVNPFHVPAWLLAQLQAANLHPVIRPTELQGPWSGEPPVTLAIHRRIWAETEVLYISFGRCMRHAGRAGALWVNIHYGKAEKEEGLESHECPMDHFVVGSPVYRKVYSGQYGGRTLKFTVVFAVYPLSPNETYALSELEWIDGWRTLPVFTTTSPNIARAI